MLWAATPICCAEQVLSGPNQAWVADITYIRLPTTFCYLAAHPRRLVAPRRRLGAVAAASTPT